MRIEITKAGETQSVKQDRLQRFLEQGWHLTAEPAPKIVSGSKAKVKATADVIEKEDPDWDDQWEAPLVSMPSPSIHQKPEDQGNENANQ